MGWRLAASLIKLREQINLAYPGRDKSSDGSIGDTAHSARKSDHNQNSAGVVCAIDIDEDLAPDIHSIEGIVRSIQNSRDPRVKYIIYEGRITVQGDITKWKPYTGPNPHRHHAHISVRPEPYLYDDARPWTLSIDSTTLSVPADPGIPAAPGARPLIKRGSRGDDVRVLQGKLGITIDGDFGPGTERAVKQFQIQKGLDADGQVGPRTWKALGL